MKRHLLTLYTRSPLHVGSGTSVDVVDLPIMRERITGFPVIPSTSLKGVLRDEARQRLGDEITRQLFGEDRRPDESKSIFSHAGAVQFLEAKLLAFPVRSLAGCFAWITCPAALRRFQRDTGIPINTPSDLEPDHVIPGSALLVPGCDEVVLEEYALSLQHGATLSAAETAKGMNNLTMDSLWQNELSKRLAIVHDENFQHFVTSCTEVVSRIAINPSTRTTTTGALFNQENIPCETLFYSVLNVLASRKPESTEDPGDHLGKLLDGVNLIQVGGDETTGHGFCEIRHQSIN